MDIKKLAKRDMSQQLIADYKPFTMVDGEGFRCAIYVSGCIFNCKGCSTNLFRTLATVRHTQKSWKIELSKTYRMRKFRD